MSQVFSKSKCIWHGDSPKPEEYVEFIGSFHYAGETTRMRVACETDYVLYVNGKKAGFNLFAGLPFEKYYDELDLEPFCEKGNNTFSFTVRYEGLNSATHIDDGAFLIFELLQNGIPTVVSGEDTLSAIDTRYVSHEVRRITGQLGLTSHMVTSGPRTYSASTVTERNCAFLPRPVRKLEEYPRIAGRPIDVPGHRIYDLGREEAGYLFLEVECEKACEIKVAYAEHIESGAVCYQMGGRDFSFDFTCTEGTNQFEQWFVRLAGRYLEVFLPDGAEILSVGIVPVLYPQTEKTNRHTGLDREIYATCVRTLRLSMHTHYEDCPWREQALYVLDSKNQMLCGYDAFEDASFQRANLVFLSKGKREDGMLELTCPAVETPAIPFFSLMYPVTLNEYVEHTGDQTIVPEVIGTVDSIIRFMHSQIGPDGLIRRLPKPYWNFYEWAEDSDGGRLPENEKIADLILNCAYVLAARAAKKLHGILGTAIQTDEEAVFEAIGRTFRGTKPGEWILSTNQTKVSEVGCAMAVLIGYEDPETLKVLKGQTEAIEATLSMKGFVYDAILKLDENGIEDILADIRKNYGHMLECGATSFWETIEGAPAFDNAGSLCHGWSALPIVYLNKSLN